jgi:hypothetical protein
VRHIDVGGKRRRPFEREVAKAAAKRLFVSHSCEIEKVD